MSAHCYIVLRLREWRDDDVLTDENLFLFGLCAYAVQFRLISKLESLSIVVVFICAMIHNDAMGE